MENPLNLTNPLNVNTGRFIKVAGGSVIGLLGVLGVLLITGMLLRVFPITGIGDYVVAAEKIEGAHFELFPQLDKNKDEEAFPIAVVLLEEASIDGLLLKKTVDFTDALDVYGVGNVDIIATFSKTVTGGDLYLKVVGLSVGNPLLDDLNVVEKEPAEPLAELDLEASELILEDAEIYTRFMNAMDIGINPLGLGVKIVETPLN